MSTKLSRRAFLHSAAVAGGILLVDIRVPLRAADGNVNEIIAGWIRIDVDGNLTLLMNATEMGQGAQSGLAQILAEELGLDWSQVRIDFAPIDREHYGVWETYQTGGSGSIRGMFDRLRQAGAAARTMLLQAAANRWQVRVEECVARSGYVRHEQSSRSASYAALARDAARVPVPKDVPLKPRTEWQLIGKPLHRLDVRSKVTGTATYGIDVRRPGMLYAAIAQSPVFKGTLASVDEAPAMRHRGVRRVLKLEKAVVVVAENFWTAQKALGELKPVWSQSPMAAVSSAEISERLRALTREAGKVYVNEGEDEAKIREQSESQFPKARRVVDMVRGSNVDDALATLRFAPQAAAQDVYKVLESAVSNATTGEGLERGTLVVSKAMVDEGPTLKRFRPRAQGRATRILKRTSHITLVVQPADADSTTAGGSR